MRGAPQPTLRLLLAGAAASLTLVGCTMPNPAFEGGEADSSAGELGSEFGSQEGEETLTTGGEATVTAGEGDGDDDSVGVSTGDGDGDVDGSTQGTMDDGGDGDGDGDGMLVCETLRIDAVADAFFQNGPNIAENGETVCQIGATDNSMPGEPCWDLNFGSTPQHWIGGEVVDAALYGMQFPADPVGALPESATIEEVRFEVSVNITKPQEAGASAVLQPFVTGESAAWTPGSWNGQVPMAPGDDVATYKFRRYSEAFVWANAAVSGALETGVAGAPLDVVTGEFRMIMAVPTQTFVDWVEAVDAGTSNGWALSSDARVFEFIIAATESTLAGGPAAFMVDYCYVEFGMP